ncbi:MAG: hypothetical protein ACFNWZ_00955 [Candidatus Absconditicoccaceae bacterium]
MSIKNTIEIIISATNKAGDALKQARSDIAQVARGHKETLQGMATWGGAALGLLTKGVKDLTSSAANTKEAHQAMDRLAKTMNMDGEKILSGLQKASKGTVANYDLILAANKAMSLGVTKNTSDFSTLMEIARVKAKNMGSTTTQAFNDIVTGLGRGSAPILDNLGIIVNATEANEEYAKSIGKTAKELTDAEKKQALINKVVADGKKQMQEMGDVALSETEGSAKLEAQLKNLSDTIGTALIPIVNTATDMIAPLIESFSKWAEKNPGLLKGIVLLTGGVLAFVTAVGTIGTVMNAFMSVKAALVAIQAVGGALVSGLGGALSSLGPIFSALTGPIGIIVGVLTALGVAYVTNLGGFRDFVNQLWEDLQPILQEIGTAFVEVFGQIWETIQEVRLKLEPILIPLREGFGEVMSEILPIVGNLVTSTFKAIGIVILSCVDTLGGIIDFLKNVFTGNRSGARENIKNIFKIRYDAIIGIFSAFNIDLPGIIEAIKTTITNLWDGMFNGLKNIASGAIGWISDKISAIWDKIQSAKDAISNLWGGGGEQAPAVRRSVGGRASGGTVLAGQLYRINELGTEYFRPAVNGTISRSPSPSSPQITLQFGDVHIGSESDMNTFTEKVRAVLIENYRNLALGTY